MSQTQGYIGRFAPSPTGPLHFGSIVVALAGWLEARKNKGLWLLRIEDLDPPRENPGAPAQIMSQLESLGLSWNGTPLFQSQRLDAYQAALDKLKEQQQVYPCTCSRRDLPPIYLVPVDRVPSPPHCRHILFAFVCPRSLLPSTIASRNPGARRSNATLAISSSSAETAWWPINSPSR